MKNQTEIESTVQGHLNELRPVPARDPQTAARARARFLAQGVSANEFQRHKGWKSIFRKEQFAMNILVSILVIAGLLAGGGITVRAAQDDLPNEPLYGLKTWSEDFSLQFQKDPEARVARLMELAQTRVQEMVQLAQSGQTPPEQIQLRLEEHLQQALQLCSNMDDAALDRTLLQLRDQLQQRDREMQQLQIHASPEAQPLLERTRTMLQTQLQLVNEGMANHEMFRNTVRNGFQYGQSPTEIPPTSEPVVPPGPNGQQNGDSTPQAGPDNSNGPGTNPEAGGPNPSVTPMPNNGGSGSGSGTNTGGSGNGNNSGGGNDSGGGGSGGKSP